MKRRTSKYLKVRAVLRFFLAGETDDIAAVTIIKIIFSSTLKNVITSALIPA